MSVHDYCNNCVHRLTLHGDRAVGGVCTGGTYPDHVCTCQGPTVTDDVTGVPV